MRMPAFPSHTALLLFLLFPVGLAGCDNPVSQTEEPPLVRIARPETRSVTLWEESSGTAQSPRTVAITPQVEGTLREAAFRAGRLVREGDVLFVIDPDVFQTRLAAANAELGVRRASRNQARIEYRRNLDMYREKAAAQTDVVRWREQLSSADALVRQAEAQVAQARIELGYTTIRAPFTGRISRASVDAGNVVGPNGGPLATLVATDPVYAVFSVNPALRPLLSPDKPLMLGIGDGPFAIEGKLDYIAPEVDASTGTLLLRGVFPNNPERLLPGQYVRVRMSTGTLEHALLVPRRALASGQGGSYLLTVDAQNRVRRTQVSTGPQAGEEQVILSGLSPDDRVIVDGMARVRPGQVVTPQTTE